MKENNIANDIALTAIKLFRSELLLQLLQDTDIDFITIKKVQAKADDLIDDMETKNEKEAKSGRY